MARPHQQFLALMLDQDNIHTRAVWVFRSTGHLDVAAGGPAIAPSASASPRPTPSPQVSDHLVIIDATSGEGRGMYVTGSVPASFT